MEYQVPYTISTDDIVEAMRQQELEENGYTITTTEICERLELDHSNTYELVTKYSEAFLELGNLTVSNREINKPVLNGEIKIETRGRKSKEYQLNYDQFCFLITLVRNNPKTVAAKLELILRYKEARKMARLEFIDKKRRELHEGLKRLSSLY
jgi:hypothetical protein